MRSADDVGRVFALREQGLSKKAIARETGVSRTQVRAWLEAGLDAVLTSPMRLAESPEPCDGRRCRLVAEVDRRTYAYLFGQYLGDGTISAGPRGGFRLRITACDAYPGIMSECEAAMASVIPRRVGRTQREGCTDLYSFSKHWPCLFPQHGRGRKHDRPMILRPWQEHIAFDVHPELFLRGLVHADGCRSLNTVTGRLKSGPKRYTYPRYLFSNESRHIRDFFTEACRRVGVEYRYSKPNTISVARSASVAILDSFIGPKY